MPPREGIGFYVWNLSCHLVKQGHQVHIVTRGNAKTTAFEEIEGIKVWRPTFIPVYPYHVHFHSLFVNKLVKDLESQVDIFQLHSPLVRAINTIKPCLVTFHSLIAISSEIIKINSINNLLTKLQTPISTRLENDLAKKVNIICCVSRQAKENLLSRGFDPGRVKVLGNGVDTEVFYPSSNKDGDRYALTVGRLSSGKGLEDLLSCAEIITRDNIKFQFFIAGDGPLKKSLRSAIRKRKLEGNVRLLGHISDRTQLANLYRNATMYIHPSHHEGLPTAVLEAMACGCPVICTAVGGIPDVVKDGENGLLISPQNHEKMAIIVLRLLSDPVLSNKLSDEAFRTIQSRYTWKLVTQSYLNEYQHLLSYS
jgi:glycosyltransferase involved in cell wall biosynthesis